MGKTMSEETPKMAFLITDAQTIMDTYDAPSPGFM